MGTVCVSTKEEKMNNKITESNANNISNSTSSLKNGSNIQKSAINPNLKNYSELYQSFPVPGKSVVPNQNSILNSNVSNINNSVNNPEQNSILKTNVQNSNSVLNSQVQNSVFQNNLDSMKLRNTAIGQSISSQNSCSMFASTNSLGGTQLGNTQLPNTELGNNELTNTKLLNTQLERAQKWKTQLGQTQLTNNQLRKTDLVNYKLPNQQLRKNK